MFDKILSNEAESYKKRKNSLLAMPMCPKHYNMKQNAIKIQS